MYSGAPICETKGTAASSTAERLRHRAKQIRGERILSEIAPQIGGATMLAMVDKDEMMPMRPTLTLSDCKNTVR